MTVDVGIIDAAACELAERLIVVNEVVQVLEALAATYAVSDEVPELEGVRLEIDGLAAAVLDLFDLRIVVNPSSTIH